MSSWREFTLAWWGTTGRTPASENVDETSTSLCADPDWRLRTVADPEVAPVLMDVDAPAVAPLHHPGYEVLTVPGHEDMRISFVNLVYMTYPVPNLTTAAANEPMDAEEGQLPVHIDDDNEEDEEGAGSSPIILDEEDIEAIEARAPLLSLRQMQRSWLALGYRKNQGNNAIGLKFVRPWNGAHFVYVSGRIQRAGISNRAVDRSLLRHCTASYVRALGGALKTGFRMGPTRCQNAVTKCYMPPPQQLCIGVLHAQNKDTTVITRRFMNVVVRNPARLPDKGPSLLVYPHGKVLCVGALNVAPMMQAFTVMAPRLKACYRTPANMDLERQYVEQKLIPHYRAPAALPPQPPQQQQQQQLMHQVRVLGAVV